MLKLKKKLSDKINGTCKEASAKAQHLNADFQGCQTKSLFVLLCQASILLPTFFSILCFGDGFFFYCNPVLLLNQLLLYAAVKHFVETSKYDVCRISKSESL